MSHDHHDAEEHHHVGYGTYFLTWFSLLVLTAVTVTLAGFHFGKLSVLVALSVATVKAAIVLAWFMHLKYETPFFHRLLLITIVALAIFIGLTFTDTWFR